MSIEQFCRGFLSGNKRYNHLYGILYEYGAAFESVGVRRMFHNRESFTDSFPAICATVLRSRGTDSAYVLSVLGYALHVTEQCEELQWYDAELMITLLVEILVAANFKPCHYCIFTSSYNCIIL